MRRDARSGIRACDSGCVFSYLAAMCGLGVLGFDPGPMVIAGASRAGGASRRTIVAFAVALIGGTAVWGCALAALLGPRIHDLHLRRLADSWEGHVAALVLGVAFLVWGGLRVRRLLRARTASGAPMPDGGAADDSSKARGLAGLMAVAAFFVLIVTSDAPFIAGVVASSHHHAPWVVVIGFVLWAIISQSPLFVFTVAVFFGADRRVVAWTERWMDRLRGPLWWVAAVLAVGSGAALVGWSVVGLLR